MAERTWGDEGDDALSDGVWDVVAWDGKETGVVKGDKAVARRWCKVWLFKMKGEEFGF